MDKKKSNGLLIGVLAVVVIGAGISLNSTLGSNEDPVIVEVESPDAQQERDRNAALQVELAFTQAMAAVEGEARETALREFISEHPNSDFHLMALDELERLSSLPADDEGPVITEEEAAAAAAEALRVQQLAELESVLQGLLDQQLYGQAQAKLAASQLSAALLAPLSTRVESQSQAGFDAWQQQHDEFLAAQNWDAAHDVRASFAKGIEGAVRETAERSKQLAAMREAYETEHNAALQHAFDLTKQGIVASMQGQVLSAVERMDFKQAQAALETISGNCQHQELSAALMARASLFAEAQQVMDAVYARLDGSVEVDITEPLDRKRAFALKADATGVQLKVQVRGERITRTDPWGAFADPTIMPDFLEQVLGPATDDGHARFALQLLLAEASLARELTAWGSASPAPTTATRTSEVVLGWLAALDHPEFTASAANRSEVLALQQLLDLSESLADSDGYEALLHARGLGNEFSLLSVWSSTGASSWGFTP